MYTLILTLIVANANVPTTTINQVNNFGSESECVRAGTLWLLTVQQEHKDYHIQASTACVKVEGI